MSDSEILSDGVGLKPPSSKIEEPSIVNETAVEHEKQDLESTIVTKSQSEEQPKPKGKSDVFSKALETWTDIDLPSLQKRLDDQGIELKEDQKKSLLLRKNLAQRTKEFKKLSDEEKLEQFKSLLKLYQNEIDSLTNKKKIAENYFFGIYRLIAEAPDPRPLLEISLDAVIEFSEIDELKVQIDRLQDELSRKADYDQLKQRLIRNEQKSAEILSNQLKAKEAEFKAVIEEKESNWNEKELAYNKQVKDARHKIEELRTSNEVAALQQLNSKASGEEGSPASSAAVLAELEIVSRDAETSKQRIFELEKRNESLRRDLSKTQNELESQALKEEFKKKVSELEGENALLIANLDQTRRKLDERTERQTIEVENLTKQFNQLSQETIKLKEKLDKTSDYDELKQENQLMKQIEFGLDAEDEDQESKDGEDIEDSKGVKRGLNSIMVVRNKELTSELADLRAEHDSMVNKIQELEQGLAKTNEELIQTQLLNDRLENDLAEVQDASGGAVSNNGGNARFSDNMSIISGVTKMTGIGAGSNKTRRNGSITGASTIMEDNSILPIITKQRDRFRDRNAELEEEIKKQYNSISDLKRQMNTLKKDNEELYERTRYLASYRNESTSFGSRNTNGNNNRRLLEPKTNVSDLENPYQASYESKLHPIEQFRIREQERINSKLSPLERLFISFSRAILATRTTRLLFVIYCVGLHCIVMLITIYAMGLSTSMIPEVGKNMSTGGVASGLTGSSDVLADIVETI
ncbi:protein CASP [[Candida] anglica]|uniref:Protein CASP n=1 Tax=[Candida] anglica TaxID=148631 RepID=A0ABP0EN00_9ASCO